MRISLVVLVLAFAGLLAADLQSSSSPRAAVASSALPPVLKPKPEPEPETVEVAFVRNGWLARVQRVVPRGLAPAEAALRELTQGPTRAERRRGIRTAIPEGARLRSLRTDGESWLASFSRSVLGGGSTETKRRRLWQIAATLAPQGERKLAFIATEGRLATTLRLGLRPGAWRAETGENDYFYSVRGLQLRLADLGYLDRSDVSGTSDYLTEQALLAFQGWEDLDRTGTVTGQTQIALFRASRPKPSARRQGRRVEIVLERGVLLLVDDGDVVRAIHTSTGSLGRTPSGNFSVYVKSLYSWSVPFQVWMPFAAYFHGGFAMHQSPDVPSYPASHGCVRLPEGEAERVYRFVDVGTPVAVR